jgi:SAM-dependent methyltransferase
VRLTAQTGRGGGEESPEQIAQYFLDCFADYFRVLGVPAEQISAYLAGKRLLEYGPGDVPGVALLMLAHGAERVWCVDRFPLASLSAKNVAVLERLISLLPLEAQQRAAQCFVRPGEPASGFAADGLEYLVKPSGLSGLSEAVDLVFSRAVLEHVNDLHATFRDMRQALRSGGVAIHEVDLKSHGLHRRNILDFLTWPELLWKLMYSGKGVPNRWRVDRYREVLAGSGLRVVLLERREQTSPEVVREVRPFLAQSFQQVSDEDLSWLSFWLVVEK